MENKSAKDSVVSRSEQGKAIIEFYMKQILVPELGPLTKDTLPAIQKRVKELERKEASEALKEGE